MEEKTNIVESLLERVQDYAKISIELYQLKAIDKSADIISSIASRFVVAVFTAFIFVVLNIGVALWLGELLQKTYYGFFLVAGFYSTLCVILYIFRNKLIKEPVCNSVITQALK